MHARKARASHGSGDLEGVLVYIAFRGWKILQKTSEISRMSLNCFVFDIDFKFDFDCFLEKKLLEWCLTRFRLYWSKTSYLG